MLAKFVTVPADGEADGVLANDNLPRHPVRAMR
jgi:hypothetical protein